MQSSRLDARSGTRFNPTEIFSKVAPRFLKFNQIQPVGQTGHDDLWNVQQFQKALVVAGDLAGGIDGQNAIRHVIHCHSQRLGLLYQRLPHRGQLILLKLALGDIGQRAIPHDGAIVLELRHAVAVEPAVGLVCHLDAKLLLPGFHLCPGGFDVSRDARCIIGVNHRKSPRRIFNDILGQQAEDLAKSFGDVRKVS